MWKLVLLLMWTGICLAQTRPTPLENPYFRTDGDLANHSLSNANSIIFKSGSTNVVVNASTFLTFFNGEARVLIDQGNGVQYLVVSNGVPYLVTTNGIKNVVLENDTTFIRQGEYRANVTNMVIFDELILTNAAGVDNSQYVVTETSLTNGAISKINIGGFFLYVTNGVLTARDSNTGNTYPIAP